MSLIAGENRIFGKREFAWLALLRQVLLRRLVNNALPDLRYLPLPPTVFICSGKRFDALRANAKTQLGQFCVFRDHAIELHDFSPDPREGYSCKRFASLDEFFSKHLVDRACSANGADVVFLPEIMRAYVGRTDQSLSSEQNVAKTMEWLELTQQRNREQRDYYSRLVQDYMSTLTYKLVRLVF